MTELARDLDKGLATPQYVVHWYNGDERIASLTEREPIPIPDRGDTIKLDSGDPQESGEVAYNSVGQFTVEDIRYGYTLVRNMEKLENDVDSLPDQLVSLVRIDVRRGDE
jgi:hypothetical protein